MISLGCAKNLVDAEVMMGSLLKEGFEITNENADADALIINTCSFIDAAQEESVDTILESAEFREHANSGQALIVSGCLSQRYRKELPKLMPEVDAFMGIDQVEQRRLGVEIGQHEGGVDLLAVGQHHALGPVAGTDLHLDHGRLGADGDARGRD